MDKPLTRYVCTYVENTEENSPLIFKSYILWIFDDLAASSSHSLSVRLSSLLTSFLSSFLTLSQVVTWFWDIVRSFEHEQKAKLLQFVTGTSGVPVQGFEFLQVCVTLSRLSVPFY